MPCILCESYQFKLLYHSTLKQCIKCGFISANMEISEAELSEIYSENYFKGGEYLNYLADEAGIKNNFRNRLFDIKKNYQNYSPKNVLEIGCAYGFFGSLMKSEFPETNYTGYDVVPEACEYAIEKSHLNVKCENYLNSTDEVCYSDVFMWDVIEHLPNPALFLKKIGEQSEVGTRLFISTGDIGSVLAKIQGRNWRQIHPPTHLHYFSKRTITRLLEKEGFVVKKALYPSVSRSLKQIFYSMFILNKKSPSYLTKKIYAIIPENSYLKINTFDLIFVMAEKIEFREAK